ncbi:hypothetical protein H072_5431 [Dactylellina haptotyla CBS 200.50]|uniref:Uncharacterized protein n=1 Tax=Dactylellina haptotyla (strain CBS 200.50) TaxID=1284197 RepID=S8ACE8_DACHA|nr:hypothetical protein H072_5431 [Dactylellina haptotyla CBS 200.50]
MPCLPPRTRDQASCPTDKRNVRARAESLLEEYQASEISGHHWRCTFDFEGRMAELGAVLQTGLPPIQNFELGDVEDDSESGSDSGSEYELDNTEGEDSLKEPTRYQFNFDNDPKLSDTNYDGYISFTVWRSALEARIWLKYLVKNMFIRDKEVAKLGDIGEFCLGKESTNEIFWLRNQVGVMMDIPEETVKAADVSARELLVRAAKVVDGFIVENSERIWYEPEPDYDSEEDNTKDTK